MYHPSKNFLKPGKVIEQFNNRGVIHFSESITMVAIVCVTIVAITLGLPTIVLIATYTRDKLNLRNKTRIKDIAEVETAITVEDKDSKK